MAEEVPLTSKRTGKCYHWKSGHTNEPRRVNDLWSHISRRTIEQFRTQHVHLVAKERHQRGPFRVR